MGTGVIHRTEFSLASSKYMNDFIKYIDDESKTQLAQDSAGNYFSGFLDYADNSTKATGIFSSECRFLSREEKSRYAQYFRLAQHEKSLLWQEVFSFEKNWLEAYGIIDLKTSEVDEQRLMQAVKCAMEALIKEECLQGYKWLGAIHYNTDNIHIHVGGVELTPSREWKWFDVYERDLKGNFTRDEKGFKIPTGEKVYQPEGKRKKETLKKMKRIFVNQLIQSSEKIKQIDELARQHMIDGMKDRHLLDNPKQLQNLSDLYLKLPNDKRLWNMKNSKKHFFGKEIDLIITSYLHLEKEQIFNEWQTKLTILSKEYERAYQTTTLLDQEKKEFKDTLMTEVEHERIKKYFNEKQADLKYRLGNVVLGQLKELDKERSKLKINRRSFVERYLTKKGSVVPTQRSVDLLLERRLIQSLESVDQQLINEKTALPAQQRAGSTQRKRMDLKEEGKKTADLDLGKVLEIQISPQEKKDSVLVDEMVVFSRYSGEKENTMPFQRTSTFNIKEVKVPRTELKGAETKATLSVPEQFELVFDIIEDKERKIREVEDIKISLKEFVKEFDQVELGQEKIKLFRKKIEFYRRKYWQLTKEELPLSLQLELSLRELELEKENSIPFQKIEASTKGKKILKHRFYQYEINNILKGIDRSLKRSSQNWLNERVFESLQEQIRCEDEVSQYSFER